MFKKFRKILLASLTAMMLVTAVSAGASAARVQAVKRVVVRSSASMDSPIRTVMKKGKDRKVLGISSDGKWIKVKMHSKVGYVYHNRIRFSSGVSAKGTFKLTFYGGDGMTASGKTPRLNHTIAVDTDVIPLGKKVYIDGYGVYYAEDTGGAIQNNIIDIFVASEAEADRIGIDYAKVYVIK